MDSGGQEQNYWPGFVDALSNVVLTLIFVLVVFVFALSMASSKVEQRMQEVTKAQQQQAASTPQALTQENAELRTQLAAAQAKIATLSANSSNSQLTVDHKDVNTEITAAQEAPKTTSQGAVAMLQGGDHVLLSYPLSVADLDDKSQTQLVGVLDGMQKRTGRHTILLRSIVGKEPYSAAQRLAYYRAIAIRNLLITKGYGDSSSITAKIVQTDKPDVGHVEIIFQRQQ